MGKSERLKMEDVRRVFRLLSDVRDLRHSDRARGYTSHLAYTHLQRADF